jgi:hypothetical protein
MARFAALQSESSDRLAITSTGSSEFSSDEISSMRAGDILWSGFVGLEEGIRSPNES